MPGHPDWLPQQSLIQQRTGILLVPAGTLVSSGGSYNSAVLITGVTGYDGWVECYSLGSGGYLEVTFTWTDSVTGGIVGEQSWWLVPGTQALPHHVGFRGPCEGDRLKVTVAASSVSIYFGLAVAGSGNIYGRHDWRSTEFSVAQSAYSVSGHDAPANIVGARSIASLGAGASDTTWCALAAARCRVYLHSSSGAANCVMSVIAGADQLAAVTEVYNTETGGRGYQSDELWLPRAQCYVVVTNNGAAANAVQWVLTASDH